MGGGGGVLCMYVRACVCVRLCVLRTYIIYKDVRERLYMYHPYMYLNVSHSERTEGRM